MQHGVVLDARSRIRTLVCASGSGLRMCARNLSIRITLATSFLTGVNSRSPQLAMRHIIPRCAGTLIAQLGLPCPLATSNSLSPAFPRTCVAAHFSTIKCKRRNSAHLLTMVSTEHASRLAIAVGSLQVCLSPPPLLGNPLTRWICRRVPMGPPKRIRSGVSHRRGRWSNRLR